MWIQFVFRTPERVALRKWYHIFNFWTCLQLFQLLFPTLPCWKITNIIIMIANFHRSACFLWESQKHLKPSKMSVTILRLICLLIMKKKIVCWKSWFFQVFRFDFRFFWQIFENDSKNSKKSKIKAKILKNQLFQKTNFFFRISRQIHLTIVILILDGFKCLWFSQRKHADFKEILPTRFWNEHVFLRFWKFSKISKKNFQQKCKQTYTPLF